MATRRPRSSAALPASARKLLRAFDANINRAREGLRVCEDLVRFCVGSPAQFRQIRGLRRALDAQLARLPVSASELVRFRDSERDPGRRVSASSVRSVERLLLINLQRTKEALRVLEETCRLIAPKQVGGFQQLRFRTYDVERTLLIRLAALRHR